MDPNIVERAGEEQREHDRQCRAGRSDRRDAREMRTMECVHGDHLQLSDAFTPANRPGRPIVNPAGARSWGQFVLAAVVAAARSLPKARCSICRTRSPDRPIRSPMSRSDCSGPPSP